MTAAGNRCDGCGKSQVSAGIFWASRPDTDPILAEDASATTQVSASKPGGSPSTPRDNKTLPSGRASWLLLGRPQQRQGEDGQGVGEQADPPAQERPEEPQPAGR